MRRVLLRNQWASLHIKREAQFHLILLPGVLLVLLFCYVPMGGIVIAFQKFIPAKGLFGDQRWVGWDNFAYIFRLPNTWRVVRNTVVIASLKIALGMIVPIVVSLMINEMNRFRLKRTIQTIVYFPNFISWVILAGILTDLLSPTTGIANKLITQLGGKAIYFLGDKRYFPATVVISDVWKNFGFGTVIYLATITNIDPSLYEVANIDGANRFQQVIHITLPGMRMIIVLLLVLNLGNVLNAGFEQIYNMYNVSVYETGDILDTMIYRAGLMDAKYGPATALGLLKSVVSLLLISSSYYFAYKVFDYRIFQEAPMKASLSRRVYCVFNNLVLILLALICLVPFIHILALSFSSSTMVQANRVLFWPMEFNTDAYTYLLQIQQFWRSALVTVRRVIIGGGLSMFLIITLAYPLSKEKNKFRMRGIYVWFFFFSMLFSGGLIPTYMLIYKLNMLDTIWALVLPGAVPVFSVILMLNFYRQLPGELEEAAYIDGAGHWRTLFQVYVPCSLAAIATLTLFTVVAHWNAWFDGLIYMNRSANYPLMSYVQTIVVGLDFKSMSSLDYANYEMMSNLSDRTLRATQIIISIIPILMVYPFLQKYFVTGITLGSVKG